MRNVSFILAMALVAVMSLTQSAAESPKVKKQMLTLTIATPNPSWQAKIEEVRQVGQELWVKTTVSSNGGIAAQVIGSAKAELAFEGPDLPVKYIVFGKTWGWKNDENGVVFLHDLGDEKGKEKIKEYEAGTLLYPKK